MLPAHRKPTHPGKLLAKILEESKCSQVELARRMGVSFQTVNLLVHEKRGLTADIAVRLSRALETSAEMWLGMQMHLDLWEALRRPENTTAHP